MDVVFFYLLVNNLCTLEIYINKHDAYKANGGKIVIGTIYRPPKTITEHDNLLYEEI